MTQADPHRRGQPTEAAAPYHDRREYEGRNHHEEHTGVEAGAVVDRQHRLACRQGEMDAAHERREARSAERA